MALQVDMSLENNFGETSKFKGAYVRVEHIAGNKSEIIAQYAAYKIKGGRVLFNDSVVFTPTLEGENLVAQAYDQLKALPKFSNATDC